MNVIVVVSDSFRYDYLNASQHAVNLASPATCGLGPIRTPNLDRLAAEGALFERAHTGSYATVPNRYELMTGRYVCTYTRGWEPLPAHEVVLAQVLGEAGYTSMMLVDTPHILKDGYHFDRGFTAWQWFRGQEGDRYRTDPLDVRLPCAPEKLRNPHTTTVQYLRNVSQRQREEDYFAPQTLGAAIRWLEANARREQFFLYVDTFDPHEPWDPPARYVDPYDPGYDGEEVIYPAYGPVDILSEAERKHCRALYAGEVSMVDEWMGRLLAKVDDLGLRDTTAIFFIADHGFMLGEQGWIGKGRCPLYEPLNHVPLIARVPGLPGGQRLAAYAQAADLMPTILDLAGVADPGTTHGHSLLPLLRGAQRAVRDVCVSTTSLAQRVDPGTPVSNAIPGGLRSMIQVPGWAMLYGPNADPQLFDTAADPGQTTNLWPSRHDKARDLWEAYVDWLRSVHTPEPILAPIAADLRFQHA
ncbi:MAG: sulfatase [Chloroflexota bacterium]